MKETEKPSIETVRALMEEAHRQRRDAYRKLKAAQEAYDHADFAVQRAAMMLARYPMPQPVSA